MAKNEETEEGAYLRGERAALTSILREVKDRLGYSKLDADTLALEREEAIAALREICSTHGDNDWDDDLHLADIIEKHLGRRLDHPKPKAETNHSLQPLRWCFVDALSRDLKARDEWKTAKRLMASGKIRYTIQASTGHWRIFLQGEFTSLAQGTSTDTNNAKAQIEQWRLDHLEMPIFKHSQDNGQ